MKKKTIYFLILIIIYIHSIQFTHAIVGAKSLVTNPPRGLTTQIFAGTATLSNLVVDGANIKWYATPSGITILSNTTVLVDGTIYYASQTLNGIESILRLPVTVKRICNSTISGNRVSDLITTPSSGTIVNWYTSSTGGVPLPSTTELSNGTTYYVEQAKLPSTLNLGDGFSGPYGIAVQTDGRILIADRFSNSIKRMNADGTNIVSLGSGFSGPFGIAIQSDGKIIVADTGNNAIKRMNANGTNIVTLASGISGLYGVAVQSDGKILATNGGIIKRFSATGNYEITYGGGFSTTTSIAVQMDGKILVGGIGFDNNTIKRITADGTNIESLGNGFDDPSGVIEQPDGKILIVDRLNHTIKRMNSDGSDIKIIIDGLNYPSRVALLADGAIIVSDSNLSLIKKISEGYSSNRVAVTISNPIVASPLIVLKLFIEGYYDPNISSMRPVLFNQGFGNNNTDVDIITLNLINSRGVIVNSTTTLLHANGTAVANFSDMPEGLYYLAIKHRNAIETWSATPQLISGTPLTYDFTTSASKAYGSNMVLLETGKYGFYSGDIYQDKFIDLLDYSLWETDYNQSQIGNFTTDLNGDGFVDLLDYSIWENNYNAAILSSLPTF